MTDQLGPPLGPGDRAPDFDLPTADRDGRISLSEYYRRGPVLLLLLRGLYCAFCRRHLSQLRSSCDLLQGAGIAMLGVVIASAERSRLYFRFGKPPCFPVAAAPDRSVHQAYRLPAVVRTPEMIARGTQRAAEVLPEMNVASGDDPLMTLHHYDCWEDTAEDEPEWKRPLQVVGYYFIDRQGVIRWPSAGTVLNHLPGPESPLAAEGQQPAGKVYRVGVLGNENNPPWEGFRRGMRDLGYVDGRNLSMEWRWSEGKPDRFPALAAELVALRPDLIVASGTQAVRAAMEATSAIPIVMTTSSYPEKIGLVKSLSHPGGNVTGLTNVGPELSGKKLELLKNIAPKVSRVAVLRNPASTVEPLALQELLTAAPAVSVEIQSVEVRSPDDFSAAFAAVSSSRVHALLALGNPINFRGRQLIADFALKNRLPSIYDERLFVDAGGLMSYAPSFTESFRRAATYVDKILKGAKPADLPVEQPTKFELVINLKTAKALGLTIPPSLLARADQVIE